MGVSQTPRETTAGSAAFGLRRRWRECRGWHQCPHGEGGEPLCRQDDRVSAGMLRGAATDGTAWDGMGIALGRLLEPRLNALCAEFVIAMQMHPRLQDTLRIGDTDGVVTYGAFFERGLFCLFYLLRRFRLFFLVLLVRGTDLCDGF